MPPGLLGRQGLGMNYFQLHLCNIACVISSSQTTLAFQQWQRLIGAAKTEALTISYNFKSGLGYEAAVV